METGELKTGLRGSTAATLDNTIFLLGMMSFYDQLPFLYIYIFPYYVALDHGEDLAEFSLIL